MEWLSFLQSKMIETVKSFTIHHGNDLDSAGNSRI